MPSDSTKRRLAAILFTDLVGSTAIMARSEEEAIHARRRHRELVRPLGLQADPRYEALLRGIGLGHLVAPLEG